MYAKVIVDIASSAVDKIFDYRAIEGVEIGSRVLVPFGNRTIEGYVIDLSDTSEYDESKVKFITKILDAVPVITKEQFALTEYMKDTFYIGTADCIRLFLPSELRKGKVQEIFETMLTLGDGAVVEEFRKTLRSTAVAQKGVLDYVEQNPECSQAEVAKMFGNSAVSKLKEKGVIVVSKKARKRTPYMSLTSAEEKKIVLTPQQQKAVDTFINYPNKTYLLHGITGSGKTEVYMRTIDNALKNGKNAIMLVPEISLTPQVLSFFRQRFGDQVALLHSGLSAGERFDEWKRIENGEATVVVGARSAIFAPLKNVGLILIDEQHENSYNSETNPRYRTEDIALFRAKYNNCPLVLGSATPSIETFEKTVSGEYMLLRMPNRVHEAPLPETTIVDMRNEIARGNDSIFSMPLLSAISEAIKSNKQTILFINRRGYTSFLRCMECGYIPKCTDCDAPLVYHKEGDVLKCHFCGKKYRTLTACPNCKSVHIRQGAIGTQKVVDEIKKLFPSVPVFRMDNDTTSGKNGHQKVLEAFKAESPAILVGTQMLAKGHDFDNVEVVGVLDADQTLYQTDYKSAERTFQLITQVSGRAGRKSGGGKVFLQTFNPKHFVYRFVANKNYEAFFDQEISVRETTNFPPYAVIVRLLVSHEKEDVAYQKTKNIFEALKPLKEEFGENIVFLNAMASPFTRLKNKYRFQVLMRFTKQIKDDIMKKIYQTVNIHQDGKCQIFVEINPSSLA